MKHLILSMCVCFVGSACLHAEVKETTFFHPGDVAEAPISESLQHLNVEIKATDGAVLRGQLIKYPASKSAILYFYPNEASVLDMAGHMQLLASRYHADVLSVDYRGYGFSPSHFKDGESKVAPLYTDSLAVYDYLKSIEGDKGIITFGYSLGTVFAIHVSTHRMVARTVLLAPGTSLQDIVDTLVEGLPWYQRMWVTVTVEPSLASLPQPIKEISSLHNPLLILHGTVDETIPFKLGKKLFTAATATSQKVFCPIEGAGHELQLRDPKVRQCVDTFLVVPDVSTK